MHFLKEARRKSGLSQQALANQAGLSLATIQNIEAEKANPSLETIKALLSVLGLFFKIENQPINFESLAMLGLPFSSQKESQEYPSQEKLIQELRIAFNHYDQLDRRSQIVLEACYLCLRDHYFTFFKRNFAKMKLIRIFKNILVTGKHIKLRRIISANFARYL